MQPLQSVLQLPSEPLSADAFVKLAKELTERIEFVEGYLAARPEKMQAVAHFSDQWGDRYALEWAKQATGKWQLFVWEMSPSTDPAKPDARPVLTNGRALSSVSLELKCEAAFAFDELLADVHKSEHFRAMQMQVAIEALDKLQLVGRKAGQ